LHDSAVGTIVNVASVNAFIEPDARVLDYGAAKTALVNLTSPSRGSSDRTESALTPSPGPVATDLWLGAGGVAQTVAGATGVDADSAREQVLAGIGGVATRRLTTPEEIATLITLLASPRLDNVIGANYVIDGGLIKTT
jgi:NAD(P)-dependent dehydrogenase (short-subunit alcohol dehydrogenase family)